MKKKLITLTVSESKRLIAKGIAQLLVVQRALVKGTIIIAGGTTNAYILEELTGVSIDKKKYTAGIVYDGQLTVTDKDTRLEPVVLKDGQKVALDWQEALEDFNKEDVFIKGGNALDVSGNVGVLVANDWGGTIGKALPIVTARGANLIMPVGLEKLIFSVPDVASFMGTRSLDEAMGLKVGLMCVSYGQLITEIEALKLLSEVEAVVPVAAGGIGASAGGQTLLIAGEGEKVDQAYSIAQAIKGEAQID